MNQFLIEPSQSISKANYSYMSSMSLSQSQQGFIRNFDQFHQEKSEGSFLNKKSNHSIYDEDESNKENIPDYMRSFNRRAELISKHKKPLKEIRVNDAPNMLLMNSEESFSKILQMSIDEKKKIDREERERKKLNKMHMLKVQQKYRHFHNNDIMIDN